MKAFEQHAGKVLTANGNLKHVMAITLDPCSNYREGLARCIISREGDVAVKGFEDKSALHVIAGDSLERFSVKERLEIANESEIVSKLSGEHWHFLGLEDPDIWIDERGLHHLYFTMPFISNDKEKYPTLIHLGHAEGPNLRVLRMTEPVLQASGRHKNSAKEVSVAPLNSHGIRLNLFESSVVENGVWYSTVRIGIAHDMGRPWEFGETLFHPKEQGLPWIGGHASPGPLLPRSFIDVGTNRLVGIINGRESNKKIGSKINYGTFSVGLFIYDFEKGGIEWVSPEPLIRDSEARTVTFASQFVETKPGEGILYAHVDDSFVRAYTLFADGVRELLP